MDLLIGCELASSTQAVSLALAVVSVQSVIDMYILQWFLQNDPICIEEIHFRSCSHYHSVAMICSKQLTKYYSVFFLLME